MWSWECANKNKYHEIIEKVHHKYTMLECCYMFVISIQVKDAPIRWYQNVFHMKLEYVCCCFFWNRALNTEVIACIKWIHTPNLYLKTNTFKRLYHLIEKKKCNINASIQHYIINATHTSKWMSRIYSLLLRIHTTIGRKNKKKKKTNLLMCVTNTVSQSYICIIICIALCYW